VEEDRSELGWDVNSLKKTVLNKAGKKSIIVAKTRWQTDQHKKWMKHLEGDAGTGY
jgi:hypothetical protein